MVQTFGAGIAAGITSAANTFANKRQEQQKAIALQLIEEAKQKTSDQKEETAYHQKYLQFKDLSLAENYLEETANFLDRQGRNKMADSVRSMSNADKHAKYKELLQNEAVMESKTSTAEEKKISYERSLDLTNNGDYKKQWAIQNNLYGKRAEELKNKKTMQQKDAKKQFLLKSQSHIQKLVSLVDEKAPGTNKLKGKAALKLRELIQNDISKIKDLTTTSENFKSLKAEYIKRTMLTVGEENAGTVLKVILSPTEMLKYKKLKLELMKQQKSLNKPSVAQQKLNIQKEETKKASELEARAKAANIRAFQNEQGSKLDALGVGDLRTQSGAPSERAKAFADLLSSGGN